MFVCLCACLFVGLRVCVFVCVCLGGWLFVCVSVLFVCIVGLFGFNVFIVCVV